METLYKVNGRTFSNVNDAEKYEKELKEKQAKEEELAKEKQERINEIKSKESELKVLKEKFYKDYGYITTSFESMPILDGFFKDIFGV